MSSTFTPGTGASQSIPTTIPGPTRLDLSTFLTYSGFMENSDGTDNLYVTYLGLIGSVTGKISSRCFLSISTSYICWGRFPNPCVTPRSLNYQLGYTQLLVFEQVFGAPLLLLDLVSPNFQVGTTLNDRTLSKVLKLKPFLHPTEEGSFRGVRIIGVLEFERLSDSFSYHDAIYRSPGSHRQRIQHIGP